jgi:hypothetical protein
MPQYTSATFSQVERACPGERHARPDRPPPSIDRWTGRISTNATSRRQHDGVRRTPEPIRAGHGGAGLGRDGAGTLARVAESEVREDLPDDLVSSRAPLQRLELLTSGSKGRILHGA